MTDLITYDAAEKDQSRSRSFFGIKDQAYHKKSVGPGTHLKVAVHKSHFEKEAGDSVPLPRSQENSALLKMQRQKSTLHD